MELMIVRHAQPERTRRGTPNPDPGLTPEGVGQAEALARWLAHDPHRRPDRIISSPMLRARETAQAAADLCDLPVHIEPRLAEFDDGAREYVPLELAGRALRERVALALETGQWGEHRFDPQSFRQRVAEAFADIIREGAPTRAMVVCHGGVMNSYLSDVLGRPHGVFFYPHFASVSRVHVRRSGTPALVSLNELPHAHLMEHAEAGGFGFS